MNWKRVMLFGALLWVAILIETALLSLGFGLGSSTEYYIFHYLLMGILVAILSYIYFNKDTQNGFSEGFKIGFFFVIVGIVLNLILKGPLFTTDYSKFFFDPGMLLGYLETLILVAIMGYSKQQ